MVKMPIIKYSSADLFKHFRRRHTEVDYENENNKVEIKFINKKEKVKRLTKILSFRYYYLDI